MAMDVDASRRLVDLIRSQRWGALATAHDNIPLASWVAYVHDEQRCSFYLHLSRLARHTRNIQANPRASFSISETDTGHDPQTLARASFQGEVHAIAREGEWHSAIHQRYLERLPEAAPLFQFEDFQLYALLPNEIRFVAGFGNAHTLTREALLELFERSV